MKRRTKAVPKKTATPPVKAAPTAATRVGTRSNPNPATKAVDNAGNARNIPVKATGGPQNVPAKATQEPPTKEARATQERVNDPVAQDRATEAQVAADILNESQNVDPQTEVTQILVENNETLLRRLATLESQVGSQRPVSLHGNGAGSISLRDSTGRPKDDTREALGYEFQPNSPQKTGQPMSKFDGTTSGIRYIHHLEYTGERHNWNYLNQLGAMIDSFDGKVRNWWNSLLPMERRYDLVFLKTEIKKRFVTKDHGMGVIQKLTGLKMAANEDVETYWYKIQEICSQDYVALDLTTRIMWFIHGLPDDIREAVMERADTGDEHSVLDVAKRKQSAIRSRLTQVIAPSSRKRREVSHGTDFRRSTEPP